MNDNQLLISWSEIAWVAVGCHSLVARAPTAKAGGPGFNSHGFLSLPAGLLMLMG